MKRGWTEPAIIWTAIVADSGAKKTPAFRAVMRPLRTIQQQLDEKHKEEIQKHENNILIYKEMLLPEWRKSKRIGNPPIEPEPPTAERLIVSDITVEALAPILKVNWRGVLLARDELAGWIKSFDKYSSAKGSDVTHWLSIYSNDSIIVDRKSGKHKTIHVPRPCVSVFGTIQPSTLYRVFNLEYLENGLASRILFAYPPRRIHKWTDAEIPERIEADFQRLIETLRELKPNTDEDRNMMPVIVPLSPEAKATWIQFDNEHNEIQAKLTGPLASAWSKLEGYAARLALEHFSDEVTHIRMR